MRKTVELFKKMGYIGNEYVEALDYTSKIDTVTKLIVERKDNQKGKLIFCHYRDEIDIIKNKLIVNGYSKDNVFSYDGRNTKKLNSILDLVVEGGTFVLIIQIQTGCEGLNLQANFSEIYFVSPHWNPSIEDQAIARCHRIGQTNPVDVFKFEMNGFSDGTDSITLEKYVNKVQEFKRDISKQILSN
jgi:SNF2 family DNA or RNA helicase